MKNTVKFLLAFAILFMANHSFSQEEVNAKEFMIGTFKYCDDSPATVVMKKNKVVETINDRNGDVVITSKLKWIDENKYELKCVGVKGKTNIKKGLVVIVYIKEIKGNEVELAFTFSEGSKFGGCFKKIK